MKPFCTRSLKNCIFLSFCFLFASFFGPPSAKGDVVPVISAFSPISGFPGSSVTIGGTNFSPVASNNIVFFGAVQANVAAADETNLSVTVPVGATYAPITVTVNGLTAYANAPYLPTFAGSAVIDTTSFTLRVDLAAVGVQVGAAIGDIDGDGKPDLVMGNYNNSSISVYRNLSSIGSPSFAAGLGISVGSAPMGVAISDVDGDGKLDVIVANNGFGGGTTVSVLRNISANGNLAFQPRADFTTGNSPVHVVAGDLDGDGKPELVTANFGDSTVSVLRNTSTPGSITTGSFAAKIDLPVGAGPYDLDMADVDGDRKLDLVAGNFDDATVSVYRNISTPGGLTTGSFAARVDFSTGSAYSVALGDLDGDGKPDLVLDNRDSTIAVLRNTSVSGSITTNSFAPKVNIITRVEPRGVAIGDVDGDGKLDIALANSGNSSVSVLKNIGVAESITTNSFAPKVDFAVGSAPVSVVLGDLDGDGKPDLAAANFGSSFVSVLRNTVAPLTVPIINPQPLSQIVAVGDDAIFFVNATGSSDLRFQWWHGVTNILGATNSMLTLTNVQLGDAGIYNVVVTNLLGSTTSSNAVLTVTNLAPFITLQPQSTNVPAGANATFTVSAGGSKPLRYQWRFKGTNISNATNSALTLTNVGITHVGSYSVRVTNLFGSTLSSNASLTVTFPPAVIRALNTNAMAGTPITVPIVITANGNESTLGFSMNFNTQRLAFASVTWGNGVAGANAFANTSQTGSGRIGFGVNFPGGTAFVPGTQVVVRVNFNSTPLVGGPGQSANAVNSFGDQPILRELYDAQLQVLSANFISSTVTVSQTIFESDVFPRANGNQALTTTDWTQIGRFVARLDTAAAGAEFQRADCAPRTTLGDGQMKVTDWVQAGRYVAGLDPLAAIGGPTNEIAPIPSNPSGSRQVKLIGTDVLHGQSTTASVILEAQGNENALGLTLAYNPVELTFQSVTLGSGAAGASLAANTSQVGAGRLGLVLALPTGNSFSAGSKELVEISFLASHDTAGSSQLGLTDQLVTRCVSDTVANELAVSYLDSAIAINPDPELTISLLSNDAVLSWPIWAADFSLQVLEPANDWQGSWTNIQVAIQTNGSTVYVTLPIASESKFFRLFHP